MLRRLGFSFLRRLGFSFLRRLGAGLLRRFGFSFLRRIGAGLLRRFGGGFFRRVAAAGIAPAATTPAAPPPLFHNAVFFAIRRSCFARFSGFGSFRGCISCGYFFRVGRNLAGLAILWFCRTGFTPPPATARLFFFFGLIHNRLWLSVRRFLDNHCIRRAFGGSSLARAQGFDSVHRWHKGGIVFKGDLHLIARSDFTQRIALVVENVERDIAWHMHKNLTAALT